MYLYECASVYTEAKATGFKQRTHLNRFTSSFSSPRVNQVSINECFSMQMLVCLSSARPSLLWTTFLSVFPGLIFPVPASGGQRTLVRMHSVVWTLQLRDCDSQTMWGTYRVTDISFLPLVTLSCRSNLYDWLSSVGSTLYCQKYWHPF